MSFDISVIIPTFNRAHLIWATLDSVLAQTHAAKEIVVVDDGSTDNTEELIGSLYPSVLYKKVSNAGAPNARNIGVGMSTAPWLAFLDSDDLWLPNKLERQAQLHALAPGIEYSFTNFRILSEGCWLDRTKFDDAPAEFFEGASQVGPGLCVAALGMYERLLRFQPIFPSCFVISRAAYQQVGGWEASLGRNLSEDFEFTLRCSLHLRMGIIEETLVGIRKHGGNFSGDKLKLTMAQLEILKYVGARHNLSEQVRAEVRRQISLRSRDAADLAFSTANFPLVRELIKGVDDRDRHIRQNIKGIIASLPPSLAEAIARGVSR